MNKKMKIGDLLVEEAYVTSEQLAEALEYQKNSVDYIPIGEALIELKYLMKSELKTIIKKYQKHIFIGELLVNMNVVTEDQMQEALQIQTKDKRKKIGEILISRKHITESDLIDSLSMQLGIPRIVPDVKLIDKTLLEGLSQSFLFKNLFIPFYKEGNTLTVVLANPLDDETLHILRGCFKCKLELAIASRTDILRTISQFYNKIELGPMSDLESSEEIKDLVIGDTDLNTQTSGDTTVEILNYIITNAIIEDASDIHIEPMEKYLRIRYRIDGILHHKTDLPKSLSAPLTSRIKVICGLDIAEKRKHQDGRIEAHIIGREIDLRVSTYAAMWGENVVIRILHRQTHLIDIDELGFSPVNKVRFKILINNPSGIVLATGPTGSGKTTTLYASLNMLNTMSNKIITVEDPIEYTMDGVVQGQFDPRFNQSYMDFLKSMMRQDPDVLMVGEIRDAVAADAAIQAALTGHRVFSTFHTDDTTGALLRLMDMDIDTFLISSTLVSVIAQRLVRILCPKCKEETIPSEGLLASFSVHSVDLKKYQFYKSNGCKNCNKTGFKGRTAIHEILVVNDAIRDAILSREPSTRIRVIARDKADLISMRDDGFYKATLGLTSLEEVVRVVYHNEGDDLTSRAADDLVAMCEMGAEHFTDLGLAKDRSPNAHKNNADPSIII